MSRPNGRPSSGVLMTFRLDNSFYKLAILTEKRNKLSEDPAFQETFTLSYQASFLLLCVHTKTTSINYYINYYLNFFRCLHLLLTAIHMMLISIDKQAMKEVQGRSPNQFKKEITPTILQMLSKYFSHELLLLVQPIGS